MRERLKKISSVVFLYRFLRQITGYISFVGDFIKFRALSRNSSKRFPLSWDERYPCLLDKTDKTRFDSHYIYHPAWAARILAEQRPAEHLDISSSLQFSTLISAFIPVKFYDYRPAELSLSGFDSLAADLLALPFDDGTVQSLSCMHVVEHVGLGRYGDPLDPDGDLKAIDELKRVLAPGGSLLFVVPIGKPRVMFNAHRIYSYAQIAGYFAGLTLAEFSLVPDDPACGGLIRNAAPQLADAQEYGCGCFWYRKQL